MAIVINTNIPVGQLDKVETVLNYLSKVGDLNGLQYFEATDGLVNIIIDSARSESLFKTVIENGQLLAKFTSELEKIDAGVKITSIANKIHVPDHIKTKSYLDILDRKIKERFPNNSLMVNNLYDQLQFACSNIQTIENMKSLSRNASYPFFLGLQSLIILSRVFHSALPRISSFMVFRLKKTLQGKELK